MPKSKFNRTDFYTKNLINGIKENDLVTNGFKDFNKQYKYKYYTLQLFDIRRFDLLSIRFYRTDKYWWIIAKINNIDDMWNDASPGDVIRIPDKRDIEDFYMRLVRYGGKGN